MNNNLKRLLHLIILLTVLAGILSPTAPIRAAPGAAPQAAPQAAPAADPFAPVFLRDIPQLTGLIEDATAWTVGGGYLYWARCYQPPALQAGEESAQNATAAVGYLRRWPLGGGNVAFLSDQAFCSSATNHWAADASGLYFWANGYIYRRSMAAPYTDVAVESTSEPSGSMVLDGDYLYWIAVDSIFRMPKWWNADRDPRDEIDYIGDGGAGSHDLIVNGNYVYWFGAGQLRSMSTGCIACTPDVEANENGGYLSNADRRDYTLDHANPLWVYGTSIRGLWCRFGNSGYICSASTEYNGSAIQGGVYTPGKLVSDGDYLYWIENYVPTGCDPFVCSVSTNGRLMKWNLKLSIVTPNPFDDPQPIACRDCGAAYSINDWGSLLAVEGGWVYFTTSNGITRKRADSPPIAWDLAFGSWEVTQSIQSLNNDVALSANKPTFVRLYGKKFSGPNVYAVDARIFGSTSDGTPLAGSPLYPIGPAQRFTADNAFPNRVNPAEGWLFQLPDSWTAAGTIKLSPQIDPAQAWNDPNRGNNALPDQSFTFTRKAPICLVTIPVRTHAPAASYNDPSLYLMIDALKRLSPTSEVWLYHQDDDVAQLEADFGIPPWKYEPYAIPDKKDNVLNALAMRGTFSDDPDACDDVGAITHYVGLVHADTPTGTGGGGENLGYGSRPGDELYVKLMNQKDFGTPIWLEQRFNTLVHELAHNQNRMHVNCGGVANPDPNFPYADSNGTNCVIDNRLWNDPAAHFGFDIATYTPISPTLGADFMSYNSTYWVSDYTWTAIFNRLSNRAAFAAADAAQAAQAELAAASSVVYLSGTVLPGGSQGQLDYAWNFPSALLSPGILAKLQRQAASRFTQASPGAAEAGAYHVRLLDANGAVLDDRVITLTVTDDGEGGTAGFSLAFPAPAGQVAKIELLDGTTLLASLQPGSNAPVITLLSPSGGETFDDQMTLSWQASDPDPQDKLLFTVQYSPDNGLTWRSMLANLPNLSTTDTVTLNLSEISGLPASTTGGLIRVAASDGYHTTFAVSQPFTVTNRAPQPVILSPVAASSVPAGQPVTLRGLANDAEDGGLSGASLVWTIDGVEVGSGAEHLLAGLAPGSHAVTLTARDSVGREETATATLTVDPLAVPQGSAPTLDGECYDDAYASAKQVQISPYAGGSRATVQLLRTENQLWACFTGLARTAGTSPGSRVVVRVDTDHSRDTLANPGDYVFVLVEDGVPITYNGTGSGYVESPGGLSGRVTANDTSWSAEMAIDASLLGGWNHVVGLDVEHAWISAVGDDYAWPYGAVWSDPSTWATTVFGDAPTLTSLNPGGATAGQPEFTLTVNGTNFLEGASVRLNGVDRTATLISSTELQVPLTAADLAAPGVIAVTVVNPGLSDAPSNTLPFYIGTTPTPGGEVQHRLFLPLMVR